MAKKLPPYIQRSLLVLIIFLMGISVARLLVSMHQQQERIDILEAQVAQLLADSTRLAIPPLAYTPSREHSNYYPQRNYRSNGTPRNYASAPHPEPSHTLTGDSGNLSPVSDPVLPPKEDQAGHSSPKFTTPHLLDLNTVDSLTLIRIPGIAGRTASVILSQRQRYGGFYSSRQIADFLTWDAALAYIDEWCDLWFTADASRLRHLPVNTASISELQRHPYINHQQAVEIVRYRTRHSLIHDATELQQFTTFTAGDIERLLPYLTFE